MIHFVDIANTTDTYVDSYLNYVHIRLFTS